MIDHRPATDQSDLERERRLNQKLDERVRRLIDTASDAVVTIDQQSVIIDWNGKTEAMFGWSPGEAVGRVPTELIAPAKHGAHHHYGLAKFHVRRRPLRVTSYRALSPPRCAECGNDFLIAWSCKGRGVCPACNT